MKNLLKRMLKTTCLYTGMASVFWGVDIPDAYAAQKLITAVFSPDISNSGHNKFINTTPNSGYCLALPDQCGDNLFSVEFPVTFTSSQALDPDEAANNARKAAFFLMPSGYRTVQVTNDVTGAVFDLKFRISGFGGRYTLRDGTWHGHLWTGGSWVTAASPCQYGGVGVGNNYIYEFFWHVPETATTACVKKPAVVIPAPFKYSHMSIGYQLITPNPLEMDIGNYSGSLTYGIGPGQDFDFGDVMVGNDNQITFDFKLAVNHLLKVEFPPGANRAVLQPKNGWQQWVNSGRDAPELIAEHNFKISSSGKFKVYMQCYGPNEEECYMVGGKMGVGVRASITLPSGIVTESGNRPVINEPLFIGESRALHVKTISPQFSRDAKMHYRILPEMVKAMLQRPGSTFRGRTTIIFDATL